MKQSIMSVLVFVCLMGFASAITAQEPLGVGSKAPDFELETMGDKKVKLSNNYGQNGKTTIVAFSRANW